MPKKQEMSDQEFREMWTEDFVSQMELINDLTKEYLADLTLLNQVFDRNVIISMDKSRILSLYRALEALQWIISSAGHNADLASIIITGRIPENTEIGTE